MGIRGAFGWAVASTLGLGTTASAFASPPVVELFGECPGTSILSISGATPFGHVRVAEAGSSGQQQVLGSTCPGVMVDLDLGSVTRTTRVVANVQGMASVVLHATDPAQCSMGYLALDLDSCEASSFTTCSDADGDSICNGLDRCEGFDDAFDTDGDGTPDGCDPCPSDSVDDSDGDGVCESDDLCPGEDDRLDTDGDTVPDCLEP